MKLSYLILFVVVLLTGFNAGIGFSNAIGYMPGFEDTPAVHAISFWQHIDHYFRARMPYFGNSMLISFAVALIFFRKEWTSAGYKLLAIAFIVTIAEVIVIFTQNLPLNIILQQLDPDNFDQATFDMMRQKAIKVFYLRSLLNIVVFSLTIMSAFLLIKPKAATP